MNRRKVLFRLILSSLVIIILWFLIHQQQIQGVELYVFLGFSGIVTYLLLGLFSSSKPKEVNELTISEPTDNDEMVIVEGSAFLLRNGSAQPGKLLLMEDRIVFKFQTSEVLELMLCKISSIRLFTSGIFFRRGIILDIDGEKEVFRLDYARDWQRIIMSAIKEQTVIGGTSVPA